MFDSYNPVSYPSVPVNFGVLAGYDANNKPIYVGRGDNTAYLGMNPCVGRVSVDPAKPGVFMMNNNSEVYDATSAVYLVNHVDIYWYSVTGLSAFDKRAAIKFMSGDFPMAIGRVNVSGVIYVGRVHYGNGMLGMYYFDPVSNKAVVLGANDQFEVLGCKVLPSVIAPCG